MSNVCNKALAMDSECTVIMTAVQTKSGASIAGGKALRAGALKPKMR